MPSAVGSFSVKREDAATKVGNKLGLADLQLDSEAFNNAFRLTAASQKLAYDLVPARNIELLLNYPHAVLHTDGDVLLAVEPDSPTADGLDATLALLVNFLNNVPPFVWEDHGALRPAGEPPGTPTPPTLPTLPPPPAP